MMLNRQEITDQVIAIVSDILHIDKSTVTPQSTFEQLGADSLDMLEIIMKVEESFHIEIDDEQASHVTTVVQAIDAVQELLAKK